jgi:hypothetical protein
MKIETKKGVVRTTRNMAILAGGLFALTGTGLVTGNIINNSTINWNDVLTISTATATTGTILSAGYCYRQKVLRTLREKNHTKK